RAVREIDGVRRGESGVGRREPQARALPDLDRALRLRAFPRRVHRLQEEGARRAERRLRPGDLGLDDRPLREEPAAAARRLAPRERDQLTLRAAGDTERDGGDAEGQEAED